MTIILTFLKQLDEIDMDLRETQDIYSKHVMSNVPTIYQLIKIEKWSNWHQNTEKKQGDDVAESGTFGFSSFMAPLKAGNKIILLIPGHALPLCYL